MKDAFRGALLSVLLFGLTTGWSSEVVQAQDIKPKIDVTLPLLEPSSAYDAITARRQILHRINRMNPEAKLKYHQHLAMTGDRLVDPKHLVRHPLTLFAKLKSIEPELEQFLITANDRDIVVLYNDLLVYTNLFYPPSLGEDGLVP